jgi:tetratricopeptide (TPR) repeat protein
MGRLAAKLTIAAVVLAFLAGGCGEREATSALYVLEELEAASAVKDPAAKVERLKIFIGNHRDSQYRFIAYSRAFEALASEKKDEAAAERFLADALAKESDPSARGELLLAKFGFLVEQSTERVIAFADTLLATERSPRLFLYMGYYIMDPKSNPDLAAKCFLKSADLAAQPYTKSNAIAMVGAVFEQQGRNDEAKQYLSMAAGNPEADGLLAKILWGEGKREEAIDLYVRCAARMPGALQSEKIDSLYALVHPGASDLHDRIMALRIIDEGPLPSGTFVDLDGKVHDLANRGRAKVVLYALSPT